MMAVQRLFHLRGNMAAVHELYWESPQLHMKQSIERLGTLTQH